MEDVPRCTRCGEVIGVYEPLILIERGEPRETSRAAEPGSGTEGTARFHHACYLRAAAAGELPYQ